MGLVYYSRKGIKWSLFIILFDDLLFLPFPYYKVKEDALEKENDNYYLYSSFNYWRNFYV